MGFEPLSDIRLQPPVTAQTGTNQGAATAVAAPQPVTLQVVTAQVAAAPVTPQATSQAPPSQPAAAQQTPTASKAAPAHTAAPSQALEKMLNTLVGHTSLEFRVDPVADRVIVKVVDAGTGKVLRQVPSEESLRIAQQIAQEGSGLLDQLA